MLKKLFLFAMVAGLSFGGNAEAQNAGTAGSKILTVYYSYSGNTKKAAETIQRLTGSDIFEIKTEGSYPEEYRAMTQQAKKEIENGYRPKLVTTLDNVSKYDVIFIGAPNWWGTIPPQVSSFLEQYDLSGKTVIPFITHGGGGFQNTVTDLKAQCQGCLISSNPWKGYNSNEDGLETWVKELGIH